MSMKPPKFLLSKGDDGTLFITHTRKPFFLFWLDPKEEKFVPLEYSVKDFSVEEMQRLKELRKIVNEWYFFKYVNKSRGQ